MARGKIRIDRRAHKRKSYRRKGRTIKRAHVKRTIYLAKDVGKRGRTPKHKRWSRKIKEKPSHTIVGYNIDLPMRRRRTILRKEVRERAGYGAARFKNIGKTKEGALSTKRTLQKIINLNPSRRSDKIMRSDLKFIERKFDV